MMIRGGGKGKTRSGQKKCEFLRIADDQSLLLKNTAVICKSYKLEYLQDINGKIQTRCKWAEIDGSTIICTDPNNA